MGSQLIWVIIIAMLLIATGLSLWGQPYFGSKLAAVVLPLMGLGAYLVLLRKSSGVETKGIDYQRFITNVRGSKRKIRILTTFTYLLSNEHIRYEFREAVSHALRQAEDLTVQFLLLDPFSEAAKQRGHDRQAESVTEKIRQNLLELARLKQDPAYKRVEVKVFDFLPPFSLFQWDKRASISFYPRDRAISEADRFECSMNSPLGRFLSSTFDDVWADEKTVLLEDYLFATLQMDHPVTGQAEAYRVHFVEGTERRGLYVLLNRQKDYWAWSFPLAAHPHVPVRLRWKNQELIGTCREIAQASNTELLVFESIHEQAVRKYGGFDYQKVLALHSAIPPTGTVTFLFTDVEDSTRLWERHPEAMRQAIDRHEAIVRQAVAAHQGYLYKRVGDAFQTAFGTASDAMLAAVAAQSALHKEAWGAIGDLRVRMAMHTGVTEERSDDYVGPLLNRVARVLSTGYGGQTLLTLATAELVRDHLPEGITLTDLGEHALRGLTRPERIFQVNVGGLPDSFPPLKALESGDRHRPLDGDHVSR